MRPDEESGAAPQADPLGRALLAHLETGSPQAICVSRDDGVAYDWSTAVLFETPRALEEIDRAELEACRGRVLEVGGAAGRASLALQARGREVVAIDRSPGAVAVMRRRGVADVRLCDAFDLDAGLGQFDAILLAMDTVGVVGSADGAVAWLAHARERLRPRGAIVIDGCAYEEEPVAELQVQLQYRGERGPVFPWLYLGFDGLRRLARRAGFDATEIARSPLGQFCARLTPRT